VTRRPTAKAMGDVAAAARAFVESGTGKGLRDTVRQLITNDEPDAPDGAASDAVKEAKEASAGLITDDEPDAQQNVEAFEGIRPVGDQLRAGAAGKVARPKRGGGRAKLLSDENAEAARAELKDYKERTPRARKEQQISHIRTWLKETRKITVSPSTVRDRVVTSPKNTKTPLP
jgi:hypothetical protein